MEDDDVIEGQPNFQNPASRGSGELGVGHVWNSSLGHDDGSYRSKGLMEDLGHGRNGGSNLVAFLEVAGRASFLNLITRYNALRTSAVCSLKTLQTFLRRKGKG